MANQQDSNVIDLAASLRGVELADRTDAMIARAVAEAAATSETLAAREQWAVGILVAIRDYAALAGLGVKGVATQVPRCSYSSLSEIYNGKYKGDVLAVCQRLASFLAAREKARVYGRANDYVPTRIGQGVERLLERTRYNRRIQLLQSPEQLGKSRVAREYAGREDSRTVMVTLHDPGTSNPFSLFLRDLAYQCGLSRDHVKVMDLRYQILSYLDNVDLVILDEFHKIADWPDRSVKALLDFVRTELHADNSRGVLLISTSVDIRAMLAGFGRRTGYNLGQMFGRMCNDDVEIDPADIPEDDVAALVRRYYAAGIRTVRKLHELCLRPRLGHFGLILDILDQAWSESRLTGANMSDSLVEEFIKVALDSISTREDAAR